MSKDEEKLQELTTEVGRHLENMKKQREEKKEAYPQDYKYYYFNFDQGKTTSKLGSWLDLLQDAFKKYEDYVKPGPSVSTHMTKPAPKKEVSKPLSDAIFQIFQLLSNGLDEAFDDPKNIKNSEVSVDFLKALLKKDQIALQNMLPYWQDLQEFINHFVAQNNESREVFVGFILLFRGPLVERSIGDTFRKESKPTFLTFCGDVQIVLSALEFSDNQLSHLQVCFKRVVEKRASEALASINKDSDQDYVDELKSIYENYQGVKGSRSEIGNKDYLVEALLKDYLTHRKRYSKENSKVLHKTWDNLMDLLFGKKSDDKRPNKEPDLSKITLEAFRQCLPITLDQAMVEVPKLLEEHNKNMSIESKVHDVSGKTMDVKALFAMVQDLFTDYQAASGDEKKRLSESLKKVLQQLGACVDKIIKEYELFLKEPKKLSNDELTLAIEKINKLQQADTSFYYPELKAMASLGDIPNEASSIIEPIRNVYNKIRLSSLQSFEMFKSLETEREARVLAQPVITFTDEIAMIAKNYNPWVAGSRKSYELGRRYDAIRKVLTVAKADRKEVDSFLQQIRNKPDLNQLSSDEAFQRLFGGVKEPSGLDQLVASLTILKAKLIELSTVLGG